MASFIDDMIIGTEIEEGHNKIVEEVVKRLAENNLYVKPEKCKWKMKKVGVSRSNNKTGEYQDGEEEGKECSKLAYFTRS